MALFKGTKTHDFPGSCWGLSRNTAKDKFEVPSRNRSWCSAEHSAVAVRLLCETTSTAVVPAKLWCANSSTACHVQLVLGRVGQVRDVQRRRTGVATLVGQCLRLLRRLASKTYMRESVHPRVPIQSNWRGVCVACLQTHTQTTHTDHTQKHTAQTHTCHVDGTTSAAAAAYIPSRWW